MQNVDFGSCCLTPLFNNISVISWRSVLLVEETSGSDRMVVWFTTTYSISAYHHSSCELESRSSEVYSIQLYVMKFASDLCPGTLVSSTNKTDRHDITEILLKSGDNCRYTVHEYKIGFSHLHNNNIVIQWTF
jgi:hypothetical protein